MSDWQPIDTAPKDGTVILLAGGTWGDDELADAPRVMAARWYKTNRGNYCWNACEAEAGYSIFPYKNPTHWMPLPEPPENTPATECQTPMPNASNVPK